MLVLLGHLGIVLENQLKFDDHIKMMFRKISKTIGLFRELQIFLPRAGLIIIYKVFVRPILIMVISFMIKRVICLFTKSWNPVNTMTAWPLLELCEVHKRKALPRTRVRVSLITSLV